MLSIRIDRIAMVNEAMPMYLVYFAYLALLMIVVIPPMDTSLMVLLIVRFTKTFAVPLGKIEKA